MNNLTRVAEKGLVGHVKKTVVFPFSCSGLIADKMDKIKYLVIL